MHFTSLLSMIPRDDSQPPSFLSKTRRTAGTARRSVASALLIAALATLVPAGKPLAEARGAERVTALREATRVALREHGPTADFDQLADTALARYARATGFASAPKKRPISVEDCRERAEGWVKEKAFEAYPRADEAELREHSEKAYPLVEVGDTVTVRYRPNPVRTAEITGTYHGRDGNRIKVGSRKLLIQDIAAANEGKAAVRRFDAAETKALRTRFVATQRAKLQSKRQQFIRTKTDEATRKLVQKALAENRNRGYIHYDGQWRPPKAVLARLLPDARADVRRELAEQEQAERDRNNRANREQTPKNTATDIPPDDAQKDEQHDGDQGTVAAPDDAQKDEQHDGDQGTVAAPDDEATGSSNHPQPEHASSPNRDETETPPDKPANAHTLPEPLDESRAEQAEPSPPLPDHDDAEKTAETAARDGLKPATLILSVSIFAASALGALALLHWPAKPRGRWSTGTAEKAPWRRTPTPAHAAARFPSRDRAIAVLAGFPGMRLTPRRKAGMTCTQPIDFGVVPDGEGVIAFVAGDQLEYPFWRQAEEAFQHCRDAEPLSSKSPTAEVHIPASGTARDDVTELGQVEGASNDPSVYWLFEAPNANAAQRFLKATRVKSTGWHVVVQTPDGHWGKDTKGVYQE